MHSDYSHRRLFAITTLTTGLLSIIWFASRQPEQQETLDGVSLVVIDEDQQVNVNVDSLTDTDGSIVLWVNIDDLPQPLAIFDSVFWEPDDTASLRKLIREGTLVRNRKVLEVGTGSGLISLCCIQAGAERVIVTDINPMALRNAAFNAQQLKVRERLQLRQVSMRDPSAWSVVGPEETFDLIISNPPWENQKPTTVAEFALYDPEFELLRSLVQGARSRLTPGGKMLLAYGCVTAIHELRRVVNDEQLSMRILDDRQLDELPEVFLPGMLIEITVP